MRRFVLIIGLLAVMLFAGAMPVFASDGDLLGSGMVAPDDGEAAASVKSLASATQVSEVVGEDALAATGLDSGVMLIVGLGLVTAGGAAVATSRKRARQ